MFHTSNAVNRSLKLLSKNLEWILIICSSILLGIWAVKDTIALRNILLVSGTLFSVYYIHQEWRGGRLKEQFTFWRFLPIILLTLSFAWVIFHYLFLSLDPAMQFEELKSTWLRAFQASILGLATGLALRNYPNRLNLLWLGIFFTFLILFYQYIPRALVQKKLLVPDYDHYLFHLKINAVLAGMILMTGIDGALWDFFRSRKYYLSNIKFIYLLFWLVGTSMVLWTFVYIVDSRNGIGLSMILYSFWFICALILFFQDQKYCQNLKSLLTFLIASLGICLILYFAYLQMTVNKGWFTLIEDAKVAVQIDRYTNWQNIAELGYPKRTDGQFVTGNNYERIAWATAGLRGIFTYPQGVGLLAYPFAKHPNYPSKLVESQNNQGIATHSGWVELGLAFGIPILVLIFSTLFLIFINATLQPYPARMTVLGFVILIFSLYTVGEAAIQHGLEMLYFLLAFISTLLATKQKY